MSDIKTSIQKKRFCDFNEQDILIFIESFLTERNLEQYVKSILFLNRKDNIDTEVSNYDVNAEEIVFNMDNLNRLRLFESDGGIDPMAYNNVVTLYEIFIAIEKVYLNNLGGDILSNRLYLINEMMDEFNKICQKKNLKFFDDDDKDIKIFSSTSCSIETCKINTLSPIVRYMKVKALYDTIDIFNGLYTSINEIKFFYQGSLDLLYNGYIRNGNVISYPLYNYFSQMSDKKADRLLSKFCWYDKDIFKALNNASLKYSERERIIFGMPIDVCEHNLIRKRFEV